MSLDPAELAHPALMAAAPYSIAVVLLGAVVGWALFALQRGRAPRLPAPADDALVARTTDAARAALGGAAVGGADAELLSLFYERWLNLPRDEREAVRGALLDDGVDLIRLADVVRRLRER